MIVNLVGVVIRGTNSRHNRYGLTKDGKRRVSSLGSLCSPGILQNTYPREGGPAKEDITLRTKLAFAVKQTMVSLSIGFE